MERHFTISNDQGIHARPATELVQLANQYQSDIRLTCQTITVDMKSIMGVLSLGVTKGSQVTISVIGTDERQAMSAIDRLILRINQQSQ